MLARLAEVPALESRAQAREALLLPGSRLPGERLDLVEDLGPRFDAERQAVVQDGFGEASALLVELALLLVDTLEAGEIPRAFVVPRGDDPVAVEALMDFVAGRVASYKRVRRVELVDAIPKSPSGKILRRQLRERS